MKNLTEYMNWYRIVYPIINTKEFQKRKTFRHHGDTTVYDHSLKVSYRAYIIAKSLHSDAKSAAIAGMLHDMYSTPWQDVKIKQPFYKMHAFSHAKDALVNSQKYYSKYLTPKIENAILRHMFPLNIIPPKYSVGLVLTLADKIESIDMLTSKEAMSKTFLGFLKRS